MKNLIVGSLVLIFAAAVANAEDVKLGFAYGGSLSNGESGVQLSCVARQLSDGRYRYNYVVEGRGKHSFFQSGIIDRAESGRYNFPTLLELKEGKTYLFTLESAEAPVLFDTYARLFRNYKPSAADLNDAKKHGFFPPEEKIWVLSPGGTFKCPIPPALLKPLQ